MAAIVFVVLLCFSMTSCMKLVTLRKFPEDFQFGVSTAAYQIEGGWNASDKGENIWDRLVHRHPDAIFDKTTGDIACDSYHNYERDVDMLKELGVNFYRFSISWSRLLPNGYTDYVSNDGLNYYNNLINLLLKEGITPMVTLYHWDLPQPLQDIGGWPNPLLADYFEDYARFVFTTFGDRVKTWLTFNEPIEICLSGYGEAGDAPMLNSSGIGDYMCGHTILLAHSRAYRLYQNEFKQTQNGMIGITISSYWSEPSTASKKDMDAAERSRQFNIGWFAHPIFSREGNYPKTMIRRIAARSQKQKYPRSRLPIFSNSEVLMLKGSSDFFGLNHYTTRLSRSAKQYGIPDIPSFADDRGTDDYFDKSWPGSSSSWLKVVPWGFRKILNWIKKEYNNPPVIITENGYSTGAGIHDVNRVDYLTGYLNSLLDALEDGCNVRGYGHWSLMDNFEWLRGNSERFGLYEVDFESPDRSRTLRDSGTKYAEIVRSRSVLSTIECDNCSEMEEPLDIRVIIT